MEIGSVGVAGAAVQQQLAATRSQQQQEYPDQTPVREETTKSSETQPANPQTAQANAPQTPERNEQTQRNEQSRVFVNAQGQKTGTIINVTA